MSEPLKKSFTETMSIKKAEKHNSDLQNLAHAMLYAQEAEQRAKNLQGRIEALASRIEAGEIVGVEDVASLYSEAMGDSSRRRL